MPSGSISAADWKILAAMRRARAGGILLLSLLRLVLLSLKHAVKLFRNDVHAAAGDQL